MLVTILTLVVLIVAGYWLTKIFLKSERDAAQPVEPPTVEEIKDGNLSLKIPVADEPDSK